MSITLKTELDDARERVNALYAKLIGEIPAMTKEQLRTIETRLRTMLEKETGKSSNGASLRIAGAPAKE